MKKILLGLVITVMMAGSGSLYSGTLIYQDDKDEFTDERELSIYLIDDEMNMPLVIGCSNKLMFIINPKLYFGSKKIGNLKIRFDDKPMYEKELDINNPNSTAYSLKIPFILEFLENLRVSKKLIMKFESESTANYTEYLDAEGSVNKFLENSLEMGCHNIEDIDPYE